MDPFVWPETRKCSGATYPSPYPQRPRVEAARRAHGSDQTIPEFAVALGIAPRALRHWLRQAEADPGREEPGDLTTDEGRELRPPAR